MDTRLINIQFKDGKVSRIPRDRTEEIVSSGKAKFISNTLFKAANAGVTVTPKMTDAQIKAAIRATVQPEKEEVVEKERQPQKRRRKKDRKKAEKDG